MSTSARGCLPRQQADYISKLAPEFGFCAHLYPGLFTCRAPSESGSVYIEIMKGGRCMRQAGLAPEFADNHGSFLPGTNRVVFDFTMQNLGTRIGHRRRANYGVGFTHAEQL